MLNIPPVCWVRGGGVVVQWVVHGIVPGIPMVRRPSFDDWHFLVHGVKAGLSLGISSSWAELQPETCHSLGHLAIPSSPFPIR